MHLHNYKSKIKHAFHPRSSLQYTSHHFTSLHFTTLHYQFFASLHFRTFRHHPSKTLHFSSLIITSLTQCLKMYDVQQGIVAAVPPFASGHLVSTHNDSDGWMKYNLGNDRVMLTSNTELLEQITVPTPLRPRPNLPWNTNEDFAIAGRKRYCWAVEWACNNVEWATVGWIINRLSTRIWKTGLAQNVHNSYKHYWVGWDSWAGMATGYWIGRSGDSIPVGTKFSAPVQTGSGPHPASYTMGTGSFPGVKRSGRGVEHPPLSSRLKKE